MTNANATHIGWTAEVKYQSAERKMTTGDSVIRDGVGEYIGSVLNEHAALVAAAPDLLAACRAMLESWDAGVLIEPSNADMARAAIRKAEGRQ